VKFAVPSTACAGLALLLTDCECCAPRTLPVELGGVNAPFELVCPWALATAETPFPFVVTLVEVDVDVDVLVEPVVPVVPPEHDLPPWAFSACTSTECLLPGQSTALCGWLLPGPFSMVSELAPFFMAIWPAVLPFPYSLVLVDPAGAAVFLLVLVVELDFTPAAVDALADAEPLDCFFA
jgi:hypothetical protein